MANRAGLFSTKKNAKREQKILQRVNVLESKLLSMIDDYMAGKPVETITDTLGNEYVWTYIGDSTYFDGSRFRKDNHLTNNKTDEIFQMLYNRMSKHGYVLCKHGGHTVNTRRNIEGWVLVFENATPVKAKEVNETDIVEVQTSEVDKIENKAENKVEGMN